jgi:hypothetical protein
MTEFAPVSSFNRKAMIGFVFSIHAIIVLCIGFLPIPFTALICYPSGFILGIVSLVLGSIALRELRTDGKNGQPFAWFAAWAGGLIMSAISCFALTGGYLIYPYISDIFQQLVNQPSP